MPGLPRASVDEVNDGTEIIERRWWWPWAVAQTPMSWMPPPEDWCATLSRSSPPAPLEGLLGAHISGPHAAMLLQWVCQPGLAPACSG